MSYRNDQSKKSSTAFDQASTLVVVLELSRNSWLIAGAAIDRHPLKKLAADKNGLLALLHRWQQQGVKAGREIKRVVVAFGADDAPSAQQGSQPHCKLAAQYHPERDVKRAAQRALRVEQNGDDAHRLLSIIAAVSERIERCRRELEYAEEVVHGDGRGADEDPRHD
jgi:hypothetical protein